MYEEYWSKAMTDRLRVTGDTYKEQNRRRIALFDDL
jgi:hypothetical protein